MQNECYQIPVPGLPCLEVGSTVTQVHFLILVLVVVAFCAALIGGGAVGAKAEITASAPAGVHWCAKGMPLWGPSRVWPGSGPGSQVSWSRSHCPGPR